MGTVKDRNGMNLTEAEEIKKRWQKYTEELYKKDHDDWDNHNDVITHLEPDILECEVKWTLGSITMNKASGSDGIPVELFQILKDDAVKVLHSIYQQIWLGFPHSSVGKDSACSAGDPGSMPGSGRSPRIVKRRKWQPTPVFLPGESHGQRSLAGYSPWGCKSWTRLID